MDARILELSHYPFFPSILALQICPRCNHPRLLHQFWSNQRWRKNCARCRKAGMTPNQVAAHKSWNRSPTGRNFFRQHNRDYRQTPSGIAANRRNNRIYEQRYPDKKRAHAAVARALKSGALIRLPCVRCGNPEAEAHHPDYTKPLEVMWLCNEHHHLAHTPILSEPVFR